VKILRLALLTSLLVASTAGAAGAVWIGPGSGSVWSRAERMPAGSQASVALAGRSVSVTWPQSTFAAGTPVSGYTVVRYDGGGSAQPAGAGCAGTLAALTCTEVGVPPGSWRYAVTPHQAAWDGAEGPPSAAVAVTGPALALSPPNPTLTSLPSTRNGSISGFIDGETLRFHLDGPGGPILSGTVDGAATPAPVPAGGSAAVTVTIPAGTSEGPHTVYAVASPSGESSAAGFVVNALPPALTTLEMFDVNQNGRVDRVVATFSDTIICNGPCTSPWTLSNVPSGGSLSSVSVAGSTATLALTEGTGAANTAVGSFTVALAASPTGVRDPSGNQSSFPATSPADEASPVPIAVFDTNTNTDGRMEGGDSIYIAFSEPIALGSIPAFTTVTETDPAGASSDTLTIPGVTAGAVGTGSNGYVLADNSSATYPTSPVTRPFPQVVRVVLGGTCQPASGPYACATNVAAGGPGYLVLVPSPALTDSSGNGAAGSLTVSLRLF
jgi:hypothetical protein